MEFLTEQERGCNLPFSVRQLHISRISLARGSIYFLTPAILAFAPKWIPLVLVMGAILEGTRLTSTAPHIPPSVKASALLMVAIVVWGGVSSIWSISPSESLVTSSKILLLGACGLVLLLGAANLSNSDRRVIDIALTLGTVLLLSQIAFELATSGAISRLIRPSSPLPGDQILVHLKPGACALAMFAWPSAVVLWRSVSPTAALIMIAASAVIILKTGAFSAFLSLGIAGLVFGFAVIALPVAARALAVAVGAFAITAPLILSAVAPGPWVTAIPERAEFSAYHRLVVWDFTSQAVSEKPLFGWGIKTSRAIPGGNRHADINGDLDYDPPKFRNKPTMMPLHPHNAPLQIWLELGFVGLLPCLALIAPIPLRIGRSDTDKPRAAGTLALFAAAFAIACLSFGLWQSWWMALLWLAAAGSAANKPSLDRMPETEQKN